MELTHSVGSVIAAVCDNALFHNLIEFGFHYQ